jgi:CheY-like chemotaxis protein
MLKILLVEDNEMNRDMLSRRLSRNGKERALAAGCDDFDTKPVDLPRLPEKIKTLLNGKAS